MCLSDILINSVKIWKTVKLALESTFICHFRLIFDDLVNLIRQCSVICAHWRHGCLVIQVDDQRFDVIERVILYGRRNLDLLIVLHHDCALHSILQLRVVGARPQVRD